VDELPEEKKRFAMCEEFGNEEAKQAKIMRRKKTIMDSVVIGQSEWNQ
jgi:hypothetical protein